MEQFILNNPMTGLPVILDENCHSCSDTVIVYGFTDQEDAVIRNIVVSIKLKGLFTDELEDLYAIPALIVLVNCSVLQTIDLTDLQDFYTEDSQVKQNIIFYAVAPVSRAMINKQHLVFHNFEEMIARLKYILLENKTTTGNQNKQGENYRKRLVRLFMIVDALRSGRKVTVDGFSNRFGVSQRTIERDIRLLSDDIGVPLFYNRASRSYELAN